jgi:hypothetical protein
VTGLTGPVDDEAEVVVESDVVDPEVFVPEVVVVVVSDVTTCFTINCTNH